MKLNKPEAMANLLHRLGEPVPWYSGWVSVHCIDPQHMDEQRSASLHTGEGAYKCHGCDLKGDAYALLQKIEGVSFKESVEILGGEIGPRTTRKEHSGRMQWL